MHRLILLLLLPFATALAPAQTTPTTPTAVTRGDHVEWGRLKTTGEFWNRHADIDTSMLRFFRQHTNLNVGETLHAVGAKDITELSTYPFLFAENIAPLAPDERHNLGEYLRRGGFLLIDACVNNLANPDLNQFLRNQLEVLNAELPDLRIAELPPTHQVYSIFFKMRQFPPTGLPGSTAPLRALMSGGRTIGILSISGIQCGRAGFGGSAAPAACTEMMTNIYLYAMTL